MKPLTSVKVKRGQVLAEWESADAQLTDAGRDAFAKRQAARMKLAQAKPQTFVVVDIRKRP